MEMLKCGDRVTEKRPDGAVARVGTVRRVVERPTVGGMLPDRAMVRWDDESRQTDTDYYNLVRVES